MNGKIKLTLKHETEANRLLRRIQRYGGWWYILCTPGEPHLTMGPRQTIIQSLAGAGLYDLIFVLLMVHRNEPFMEHVFEYMLLDEITPRWAEDRNRIIKRLIAYFA